MYCAVPNNVSSEVGQDVTMARLKVLFLAMANGENTLLAAAAAPAAPVRKWRRFMSVWLLLSARAATPRATRPDVRRIVVEYKSGPSLPQPGARRKSTLAAGATSRPRAPADYGAST